MKTLEYGVGKISFDGIKEHSCVKFGNGKTRMFTNIWDKNNVGLKLCATKEDLDSFSYHEYDKDNPPHETAGEEIYILFDNPKSIDAMIGRLEYLKEQMTKDTEQPKEVNFDAVVSEKSELHSSNK